MFVEGSVMIVFNPWCDACWIIVLIVSVNVHFSREFLWHRCHLDKIFDDRTDQSPTKTKVSVEQAITFIVFILIMSATRTKKHIVYVFYTAQCVTHF